MPLNVPVRYSLFIGFDNSSLTLLGLVPEMPYKIIQKKRAVALALTRINSCLVKPPVDRPDKGSLSTQETPTSQDSSAITPDVIANLPELL